MHLLRQQQTQQAADVGTEERLLRLLECFGKAGILTWVRHLAASTDVIYPRIRCVQAMQRICSHNAAPS